MHTKRRNTNITINFFYVYARTEKSSFVKRNGKDSKSMKGMKNNPNISGSIVAKVL